MYFSHKQSALPLGHPLGLLHHNQLSEHWIDRILVELEQAEHNLAVVHQLAHRKSLPQWQHKLHLLGLGSHIQHWWLMLVQHNLAVKDMNHNLMLVLQLNKQKAAVLQADYIQKQGDHLVEDIQQQWPMQAVGDRKDPLKVQNRMEDNFAALEH